MNRISGFLLFSVMLFMVPLISEAKIIMGEHVRISEYAPEEIFTLGDEIRVTAPLRNEFIGIGRRIHVQTNVEGDLIGIGLGVDFSGNAESDAYLFGFTIGVEGNIDGSITALGKNVNMKSAVGGNLRVSAENITIDGEVKGKTILWGKSLFLKGRFNDVVLYGNNLQFAPGTVVNGDLTYSTPQEIDLSQLHVRGEIKWNKPIAERAREKFPIRIMKKLYTFFSLLFPTMIMLWSFPNLFRQTTLISGSRFIRSFWTGLLLIILTVIALLVIFITIIGAPLGLIGTSFFFSAVYISRIFPSIFVGRKILFKMQEKTTTWVLAAFIGIFLFSIISFNPVSKIILNIISIPAGFGALFMGRVNLMRRLKKEKIL